MGSDYDNKHDQYDELWSGGARFYRSDSAYPLGSDAILLANFARIKSGDRGIDLGAGAGYIAILLALSETSAHFDCIELESDAANLCRLNVTLNSLDGRVSVYESDLRRYRDTLSAGVFDLVVSNPPYFRVGSGRGSTSPQRSMAREESSLSLNELLDAAGYLCRFGGRVALVHRAERLTPLLREMSVRGIEPKRLRFVHARAGSEASLVLVEGRRGGKPGVVVEPALLLRDEDGNSAPELCADYRFRYGGSEEGEA